MMSRQDDHRYYQAMSPEQPQRVVYQQPVPPPSNGMAVTSLVFGIIAGLVGVWAPFPVIGIVASFVAFLPALFAIIFGHAGLQRAKRGGAGKGKAIGGLILGYVTIALIVAATLGWGALIAFA